MKEKTIVEFTAGKRAKWGENIKALVGQQFIIKNVEFDQGNFGTIAIFEVGDEGKKYYTSSRVLIEQAKEIQKLCNEGKLVKVTLKKVKRYLTF